MARDNYSYKKYQRELTKKKKKEAKLQKKLDKKNAPLVDESGQILPVENPEQVPGADTTTIQ